jgi:hypothetical protein
MRTKKFDGHIAFTVAACQTGSVCRTVHVERDFCTSTGTQETDNDSGTIDLRNFRNVRNLCFNLLLTPVTPNVMAEWLTLLSHIRDVPGSNLGRETGYPE